MGGGNGGQGGEGIVEEEEGWCREGNWLVQGHLAHVCECDQGLPDSRTTERNSAYHRLLQETHPTLPLTSLLFI